MPPLHYHLASGSVAFHMESHALCDTVRSVLGRLGLHPGDQPRTQDEVGRIELAVVPERRPVPEGATLLSVVKRSEEYDRSFTAWREGQTLYLSDTASLIEVRFTPPCVRGYVHADAVGKAKESRLFLTWLLTTTIALVLREQDVFSMHAAALCKGGDGVLIVAPPDCGKSTLSYSLVRHGWDYLSDDFVVLHAEDGLVEAAPFRRTFGLDVEVGAFFPELDQEWERPFEEEDKWSVAMDALYPGRLADRCIPRVLLFPQIVDQSQTEVREISHVEALHRLVRQSGLLPLTPETSQRQMECLAALVKQTRCYRIFSGRDLIEEPWRASAVIEPLLRQSQAIAGG